MSTDRTTIHSWWQKLVERVVSREAYIFLIVTLGMYFVFHFAQGNPSQGIWTVEYARGLITLTFSVGTMVIAVVLILTAVLNDPDGDESKAKARFDRAKEVLTLLIGIFGTIVGFYFGSLNDDQQARRAVDPIARLGGEIRGGSAFLIGPSFTDDNIDMIKEYPEVKRLFLENTRVTDAGLKKLIGLRGLESIKLIGTNIDPKLHPDLREKLLPIQLTIYP